MPPDRSPKDDRPGAGSPERREAPQAGGRSVCRELMERTDRRGGSAAAGSDPSSSRRIMRISEVRTENSLVLQESTTARASSVRKNVVIWPSCRYASAPETD